MCNTKRTRKKILTKSCLFKCCIGLCLESQTSNMIRWSSWNMNRGDEWFKVKTHREIPGPLSLAFMRWALLNYLMALGVCSIPQYLKCPSKHARPACVYVLMCISDGFCFFFLLNSLCAHVNLFGVVVVACFPLRCFCGSFTICDSASHPKDLLFLL